MFDRRSCGELDNLGYLANSDLPIKQKEELIGGLAKYSSKWVYDDGLDNAGSFARFIGHGRRYEVDYAVAQLRSNLPYQANRNVKFTANGRAYNSDIDGSLGGVAVSLKRQGKTVDSWVSGKSDEFLEMWFKEAANEANGTKIEFIIGGGQVSAHTKSRLDEILKGEAFADVPISYTIKNFKLKEPPPIPPFEP